MLLAADTAADARPCCAGVSANEPPARTSIRAHRGLCMKTSDIEPSWNGVVKFLHWLIALLIFTQFALGWLAATWRLSPTKLDLFVWHKSIGMLVLTLVVLRLVWRLATPAPPLPAGMPAWERAAAHTSHGLLYLVMLGMP